MVFDFSAEQVALRSAVRQFAATVCPESELRRVADTESGYDVSAWTRMAAELGVQGLAIPEEFGGSGATAVELAIVLEELGARLMPGPILSTVLAGFAISSSDHADAKRDLLPGIASGTTIATLAVAETTGRWSLTELDCRAGTEAFEPRISGIKRFVVDGQIADLIVVIAACDGEPAVFAVDAHDPTVRATSTTAFDLTRRLADLEFRSTPARQIGGADLATRLLDLASVLVAAEQTGGAQAALDMAVEYAKTRVQFGRSIGSFQAIKHMCADMLLEVESARSAAYYAAWALADEADDAPTAAPLAKAYCSDTFLAAAAMNMQVHGGISFTWEHPAHLYYRRAKSGIALWGSPAAHRELLASRLGV